MLDDNTHNVVSIHNFHFKFTMIDIVWHSIASNSFVVYFLLKFCKKITITHPKLQVYNNDDKLSIFIPAFQFRVYT